MILLVFIALCAIVQSICASHYTATDYRGQTITLEQPTQRIIALAPHIVENLFSAGLGDRIIGTVEHADFPETAKKITSIGTASGMSIEKILALKPDLVISWLGGGQQRIQEKITRFGIPVYADDPRQLADIARSIKDFAALGDTLALAKPRVTEFSQTIEHLGQTASQKPPLKVFYQIGHQPLRTLNGEHLVSDIISRCGGRNIFAAEQNIAPVVSFEALINRDPDVIFVGTKNFSALSPPPRWLKMHTLWATHKKQYHALNPDWLHRATLRTADGAKAVCHYLSESVAHPKP
jgi:iron complex transport system substrate-binding protein